jgi:hypothetical protein
VCETAAIVFDICREAFSPSRHAGQDAQLVRWFGASTNDGKDGDGLGRGTGPIDRDAHPDNRYRSVACAVAGKDG